jgi:nicotinate-nucleotide adenylyltransferase
VEIALLGGSFNPPHVGHLMAAVWVHACERADQVWLMPAYRHPFGKELVDYEHRVRMCELVARESSGWLHVSQIEREVGGEGRTVDTLEHLREKFKDDRFTLVIGSDILPDLPSWKDFDRIQAMARVLVLHRAGYPAPQAVGPPLAQVSSSEIRQLLERNDAPVGLVPRTVIEYARARGLYGLR